jgi:hypothetical protein
MAKRTILSAIIISAVLCTGFSPVDSPTTRHQVKTIHRLLNEMFRELSSLAQADIKAKKEFPGHHTFTFEGHWYEVDYLTDEDRDVPGALYFFDRTGPTDDGIEFAVTPSTGKLDSVWTAGKWYSLHQRSKGTTISETELRRLVMHYHHVINLVLQHLQDPDEE